MKGTIIAGLLAPAMLLAGSTVRADLVEFQLPGVIPPLTVILQGTTRVLQGAKISFKHPKFDYLYFRVGEVDLHKVPTNEEQFAKMLSTARRTKDADGVFAAGQWAMRHALLPESYEAIDAALEIDPQHAGALHVKALKAMMDKPLGDAAKEEAELRGFVRKKDMKVALSNHFILLHDTPDKPDEDRKKPRAQERLELLEMVYESFLLLFYSQGIELEIPQQRLKVVLFNEYNEYLNFSTALDTSLRSASGYWHPEINISVFYDHGTDEAFLSLQKLSADLNRIADDARRNNARNKRDAIQLARTMELLVQISQENEDIEVVSHECTHQMAGNTGLLPRQVQVPAWVHEGLATYFESPGDASWSGIGAVNKRRLDWYRQLEADRQHSNIDFIVGDQIFDYARSHGAMLHGYGQSWALTHFLVDRHFKELMEYYRLLGEMPRDVQLNAELLTHLFNRAFGEDRNTLDGEWRTYMRGLKTDIQKVLGE